MDYWAGERASAIPCLFGFSFSIKEMALKIATKSPSVTKGLPDSLDKVCSDGGVYVDSSPGTRSSCELLDVLGRNGRENTQGVTRITLALHLQLLEPVCLRNLGGKSA